MFLFKRSNGIYYLYFNCETTGKRKAVTTKERTYSKALHFLKDFRQDIKTGASKIKPILLISELKTDILNYSKNDFRHKTLKIYIRSFQSLISFYGDKPINLLTPRDIENFKSHRLLTINSTSFNIELRTLKAAFNRAVKLGYIKINPFNSIKQIPIPEKQILCFSDDQIRLLLNNTRSELLKRFILVSLYTGLRINEVIHIQWKDIDFENGVITVGNKESFSTKSGKIRKIPINEGLQTLLNKMFEAELIHGNIAGFDFLDKYIFHKHCNFKYASDYISKAFKKLLRSLNFDEKYHFHCLRHTFITNLIRAGSNINYVKELAGHSDIKTTMNYVHISTSDLINTINKLKYNY